MKRHLAQLPHYWPLLALLLVAFLLRAYRLDYQELRGDEAFSYLFANRPLLEIVPTLIEEADPHPPLHYLMVGGWLTLTGDSEYAMRYPSVLMGLLIVPALYQLGRAVNKKVGWLAALLAAVSPSLIWLAQDLRSQYALAMVFTTLATVLLLRILDFKLRIEASPTHHTPSTISYWVAYALLAALAMYSHYYAIFALLAHGLYLVAIPEKRRFLRGWVLSGLGAAVLFTPWLWVMVFRLSAKQLADPFIPKLADYLTQVGVELTLGRGFLPRWGRWLFLAVAAVVVVGYRELRQKQRGLAVLLGSWLVLATLSIFLILFRRATFNAFYITVAAPAWLVLAAVGFHALGRWPALWRGVASLLLAGWLVGMAVSLRNIYVNPTISKSWGYRETAAHLSREAAEGDLFIAHFPDPSFDYYFRDIEMPRTIAPRHPGQTVTETQMYLAALAAEHDRLWFVPAHRSGWDPTDSAYEWLEFEMVRVQEARYNRLELLGYRPPRTMDAIATPVERQLRDELRLKSVYMTVDGQKVDINQAIEVTAGQRIKVYLEWHALANIDTSYTVFVHLLGDDAQMVAQHDGLPVNGNRPTLLWKAGDVFWDVHELQLPEQINPASGTLFVGLYTTEGVERQVFADGQDAWPLVRVIFER